MKWLTLSPRDRRALGTGGALIILLIGAAHGVPRLVLWSRAVQLERQSMTARYARAEAMVHEIPTIRSQLRARSAELLALAPQLLGGRSASSAAATLAGLVSGSANSAGMSVGAIDVGIDSAETDAFVPVRARAQLTGDVRGIARLLQQLESGPILLRVRELTITQTDPGAGADRPEELHIELVVDGLMLCADTARNGDQATR
ncbi:MAG TPA: GspMb/PilO family protein [Gemmatimonadaceae bacterium]|nr:GspMb/PilO family protein [Gemmatimonadaceae bacterium]